MRKGGGEREERRERDESMGRKRETEMSVQVWKEGRGQARV